MGAPRWWLVSYASTGALRQVAPPGCCRCSGSFRAVELLAFTPLAVRRRPNWAKQEGA